MVALCDAYTGRLDRARARTGGTATVFQDYRALLASPSVDAVFIATPDHWHKTMAVDALAAGKDVYLEKPMSFVIADGPAIVDAVKRSGRILQVGSQGVSRRRCARRASSIKAGALGQVTMVRAAYNRNGDSGAWLYPIPPDASPATVNWDQFLGPAPKRPFDLNRFFRWRCYWDYSGGIATDLFVHLVTEYHQRWTSRRRARDGGRRQLPIQGDARSAGHGQRAVDVPRGSHGEPDVHVQQRRGHRLGTRGPRHEGQPAPARRRTDLHAGVWPRRQPLGGGVVGGSRRAGVLRQSEGAGRRVPVAEARPPQARTETWRAEGRDDDHTHIANFVSSVKTRTQPVEDAVFGHRAAACAHMVNQSIREKRIVEWKS